MAPAGELRHPSAMADDSDVDESGTLLRQGAAFVLRRDLGGVWLLELSRVPVDLVGKRVRMIGRRLAGDRIEVEGIRPLA